MRVRPLISIFGFLAPISLAAAGKAGVIPGKYKWAPAREVVSIYQRHHLAVPNVTLWLNEKGVFRHVVTDSKAAVNTVGTYQFDGENVVFKIETGDGEGLPRSMRVEGSTITAAGSSFILDKAFKVAAPLVVAKASEELASDCPQWILGTWTLRGDSEDASTRFSFTKDGRFRYKGLGGTSAGLFKVYEDCIEIQYTEVDGSPVERGLTMKKSLPLRDGGACFWVDTYRFQKGSR